MEGKSCDEASGEGGMAKGLTTHVHEALEYEIDS